MSVVAGTYELIDILGDLSEIESNKLLLWTTIYIRKCEEIKIKKIKQFKEYFESQISFYKRSSQKYSKIYDNLLTRYEKCLNDIIKQYNFFYEYIQNELVFAQTNQKIAIANFMMSKNEYTRAIQLGNVNLMDKASRKVFATAQKKLNYDVVIEECNLRLKKCMKESFEKLERVFDFSNTGIDKKKKNYFERFKYFFKITFSGEKCFKNYVLEGVKRKINDIERESISINSDTKIKMLAFISQMEKIRFDINLVFNETLNKN